MKYIVRIFTVLSCIAMVSRADNMVPKNSSRSLITLDQAMSHYENQKLYGGSQDAWLIENSDDLNYDAFHLFASNVAFQTKRNPSLINEVNELGDTPLHILARNHPLVDQWCMKLRGGGSYMQTILETCRALVSAGADLTKKNIYGLTALETAQLHRGFDNKIDSVVVDFLSRAEKWSKYPLLQKALIKIGWL